MAARCCRLWLDDTSTLDTDAVALADHVTRIGEQQLPRSPFVAVLRSSFLMDVQGIFQSGLTELKVCRCMTGIASITLR
jgi:hypothetical protein